MKNMSGFPSFLGAILPREARFSPDYSGSKAESNGDGA
jgi:hypothetical protein